MPSVGRPRRSFAALAHPPPLHDDTTLLRALDQAPRRYRMPALPPDAAAAAAIGPEAVLAFAIETARRCTERNEVPAAGLRARFTAALAHVVRKALDPADGDPAFQALVLRQRQPEVGEYVQRTAHAETDRRTVQASVDAVAHPGKLRNMPAGPRREALERLHALAEAQDWPALRAHAGQLAAQAPAGEVRLQRSLTTLLGQPSLSALERCAELQPLAAVQRYRALCERTGPAAGTTEALAKGNAAGRRGTTAEAACVSALAELARALDRPEGPEPTHRVARNLLLPAGFPGAAANAKNEWDAAIVRAAVAGGDAVDIVLLAEVKASPEAAVADVSRLVRGLRRFAATEDGAAYALPCAEGLLQVTGASLRRLQAPGYELPPQVIYCCTASSEARPHLLHAASKAVLLTEPASVAFACAVDAGEDPPPDALDPVWLDVLNAPRLRSVLHQYDTARAVREAMFQPDDLHAAAARIVGR